MIGLNRLAGTGSLGFGLPLLFSSKRGFAAFLDEPLDFDF